MTSKEKWIKFWNARLNNLIHIRFWFIKTFNKPTIEDGYRSIEKKGYVLDKELIGDFTKKIKKENWGSARPDMDSVFVEEMANIEGDTIKITTRAQEEEGRGWNGEKVTRPAITGMIQTDPIYDAEGLFSSVIHQDNNAVGSWDAWWFFVISGEDDVYQEIDMTERFFDVEDKFNRITTSVHHADHYPRVMYNAATRFPDDKYMLSIEFIGNDKFKLYYNGVLVFKGLQWVPTLKMCMIVGSGLLGKAYSYPNVKNRLDNKDYFYDVSEIKKWKNG